MHHLGDGIYDLREGDTFVVWKLDQLGRDLRHLVNEDPLGDGGDGQTETNVAALCAELGIARQTLYRHMSPEGVLRPDGERLLAKKR